MSRAVIFQLGERRYEVLIGDGILACELHALKADEVAVIVDSNVVRLPWAKGELETLSKNYPRTAILEVPAGESSKCMEEYSKICSQLASHGFSRKCLIVAFGGGVVGDLAGFVAATWLRGVRLVQVPTTVLAMVDSSVGGKTGINLPEGKNLVGAFYQPERVIIDVAVTDTLPARELSAGMAEIIKYAMIRDTELWRKLRDEPEKGSSWSAEELYARCVQIKADVVMADERETTGQRAILNYGHTMGHAIEAVAGYGHFLHGEAVAIGLVVATRLSEMLTGLPEGTHLALRRLLEWHQLPSRMPDLDFDLLLQAISRDKKSTGKSVRWILLKAIGETVSSENVTPELLKAACRDCS